MGAVSVTYYTDPACPHSWAAEPALRRVQAQFGEGVRIAYVMGGLARTFEDLPAVARRVLDAASASGMPVDARLWLEHPPASSYPACIAIKAAAEQGRDGDLLRRVREGLMCERRKLDTADALTDVARSVEGLDVRRFCVDLASHAILEAFGADLERTRAAGALLPTFVVEGAGAVSGIVAPEALLDLVRSAGGVPAGAAMSVEDALRRFGRMATAEVAAVCDLPGPRAPAELWRLAAEWRVRAEHFGGGELWSLA